MASKMTAEQIMKAEIEALRAENEALRAKKAASAKLTCKVSEKGALSVYGIGRFPGTFYKEQWEKIFAHADEIKAFMKENDHLLATKGVER